ncbi:unnamed protein product [Strongylus vulgaris]|uniref:Uncharacterized protein n=1 Tax=Strongylus vulgaris TaxID=40348 RepID=A0A3P7JUD2_STRVU|nr:unnamed protein product [Strongylus vulgaris]
MVSECHQAWLSQALLLMRAKNVLAQRVAIEVFLSAIASMLDHEMLPLDLLPCLLKGIVIGKGGSRGTLYRLVLPGQVVLFLSFDRVYQNRLLTYLLRKMTGLHENSALHLQEDQGPEVDEEAFHPFVSEDVVAVLERILMKGTALGQHLLREEHETAQYQDRGLEVPPLETLTVLVHALLVGDEDQDLVLDLNTVRDLLHEGNHMLKGVKLHPIYLFSTYTLIWCWRFSLLFYFYFATHKVTVIRRSSFRFCSVYIT